MNENQRAALLFSQSVTALIEALGMMSENMQRQHQGYSMSYDEKAFSALVERNGIRWNAAIKTLREV